MADKRCVSTRSVQFSGNHHKYYIEWALVISCCVTGTYQPFRGACASSYTAEVSRVGRQTHFICKVQERANQMHMSSREKTMVNRTCENHTIKMDLLQWT